MRAATIQLMVLFSAAALSFAACTAQAFALQARPHIILIRADDLGYEGLSACGGTSYTTPLFADLIDSVDFDPTLAALDGYPIPAGPIIDGISFATRGHHVSDFGWT